MGSEKVHLMRRCTPIILLVLVFFWWLTMAYGEIVNAKVIGPMVQVPILLYHRFGPAINGMTVTTGVFESHLKYLNDHGYPVIPLRNLVDYLLKEGPPPGNRSVIITIDDGHRSVYLTVAKKN